MSTEIRRCGIHEKKLETLWCIKKFKLIHVNKMISIGVNQF